MELLTAPLEDRPPVELAVARRAALPAYEAKLASAASTSSMSAGV